MIRVSDDSVSFLSSQVVTAYVHFDQVDEKKRMHQGVLRELERIKMKEEKQRLAVEGSESQ